VVRRKDDLEASTVGLQVVYGRCTNFFPQSGPGPDRSCRSPELGRHRPEAEGSPNDRWAPSSLVAEPGRSMRPAWLISVSRSRPGSPEQVSAAEFTYDLSAQTRARSRTLTGLHAGRSIPGRTTAAINDGCQIVWHRFALL
jgi:hypothetical protein